MLSGLVRFVLDLASITRDRWLSSDRLGKAHLAGMVPAAAIFPWFVLTHDTNQPMVPILLGGALLIYLWPATLVVAGLFLLTH